MSDPEPSSAALPTPVTAPPQPPKSPPLAFEKTPNDALIPPLSPPANDGELPKSPSQSAVMGRLGPLTESPLDLQAIIEKQAETIHRLHKAFAAEKEVWDLEKKRYENRIYSLEQLLKNGEHHSPAKSPILTPSNDTDIVSPHSRPLHASGTLPTINEDENIEPLSSRREGAPQSIILPSIGSSPAEEPRRQSLVTFTNAEGLKVEEIPPPRIGGLSPPPPNNRLEAGHTPVRVPRPLTPPPQNMSLDGIEDTPTRNNTHINALLTQSSDEEEDMPLKGPLNMPELPHRPDESNFTLDALTQKLQHIESHPDEAKPMVFSTPTPGLASPANEPEDKGNEDLSPGTKPKSNEAPFAPNPTRTISGMPPTLGSNLSPPASNTISPEGQTMSPQEVHEAQIQQRFEEGGIRLKKKTSTNFGAPFGSLGGFQPRKLS